MLESLFEKVQLKIKNGESREKIAEDLDLSLEETRYLADAEVYEAVQRALSRPASEYRSRPRRTPQATTE
jgi:orotate phosphoribosyltransferase-like protein